MFMNLVFVLFTKKIYYNHKVLRRAYKDYCLLRGDYHEKMYTFI